jgi:ADP-ribose pyrophosphatase YjhB (NUDIX family)
MVELVRGERIGKRGRLAVVCSAAVIEPTAGKILLVQRADNGRWAVPGGYIEPGESLIEACAREVLEESGLCVRVEQLSNVYTNPHLLLEYPNGNRLQLVVLHFAAEPIGGALRSSEETTRVGCLSRRIHDAFAAQAAAFVRDDFSL